MYSTLQEAIGPELHQIPDIDEYRWKWVVLCTRWIYRYGRPGRSWGKDFKAWLGGALEKKSEGT